MNILYLCDEYPPGRHGGIGTAVQLLARQMAAVGHTVVVAGFYDWGYGGADYFLDEGVHVYRYRRTLDSPFFSAKDKLVVRAAYKLFRLSGVFHWDIKRTLKNYGYFLEELIRKYKIDIVEMPDFNEYVQFCKSAVLFPKLSKPTVVKLHGSLTYFLREEGAPVPNPVFEMDAHVLTLANAVASVSKYTARRTAQYFNYAEEITILHNGITVPHVGNVQKLQNLVVFSGSLVPKKGIYQLLQAWNIVANTMPEAILEVYGKGPITKLSEELYPGARRSVRFMGHVKREELLRRLAAGSVAVFPSFAETFGLAPVEAMACGTAVIFTTRTSGPEILEDGVSGVLVDPINVNLLAEKILGLLSNPHTTAALAEAGQKRAVAKFGIEGIAEQHLHFYQSIVKRGAAE